MKIEVYCLANNEEKLMPYFMRHYNQFAKVILLESNSTDKTIEIAHLMGAEIWSYNVPDEIDDRWFTELKNNCWKKSHADWVMIVDADEFIYHPQLVNKLKHNYSAIIQPRFYNMYSEVFPTTNGQIYDEVIMGAEQTAPKAKMNIFRPRVKEINYLPGCHEAFPNNRLRIDFNSDIKTLHMRNLSKEFVIERNLRARRRNSAINKANGWGCYVDWSQDEWIRIFDEGMKQAVKII